MGLVVDGLGRRDGRRLDQAEQLASLLIDPVPQVPGLVLALRPQVRQVRLRHVVSGHTVVERVDVHEERHCASLGLVVEPGANVWRHARAPNRERLPSFATGPPRFPATCAQIELLPGRDRYAWC